LITGGRVEKPPIPQIMAQKPLDRGTSGFMQTEMKNAPPHDPEMYHLDSTHAIRKTQSRIPCSIAIMTNGIFDSKMRWR
jgi:hypothetical protein